MKRIFFVLSCVLLLVLCPELVVAQSLSWDASTSSIKYGNKSYKMVRVDGGTFKMGATPEQRSDAFEEEMPAHDVTLSDYYIGATEVPQWLWTAVMGSNPSRSRGDNLPVESVSWNDCVSFIKELNSKTGQTFALPTEAQWEYAARGGKKSIGYKYPGSNNAMLVAWFEDNSNDKTQPVGKKTANELGLYDMGGNVNEWCADWFGNYSSTKATDPVGPTTGTNRVYRGGSWFGSSSSTRVSQRYMHEPSFSNNQIGLRLAAKKFNASGSTSGTVTQPSQSQPTAPIAGLTWDENTKTIHYGNNSYKMIYVDGGTFKMGATAEQGSDAWDIEKPVHSVTLSGYYIGQTEVPQWLWTAVMGSNPSNWKGDNLPVEKVSWDDCQTFLRKLNAATGMYFKLPTEAQWEYAARGGKYSRGYKYAGSNNLRDVAWYDGNSGNKTHMVGSKAPNELELYDMSGNVWEWCGDWFSYYPSSAQTNPTGPLNGSYRVYRGGSWYNRARNCRVSNRHNNSPGYCHINLGLRLAHQ